MNTKKQTGAAAIEFAAVFVVFFLLFYAVVGYTLPLLLAATYQEVAAEALREAIRDPRLLLEPSTNAAEQQARRLILVEQVIADTWLPEAWAKTCSEYPDGYLKVGDVWSVCLRHDNPRGILPSVSLLGWQVPQLPAEIRGEASIQIR